MLGRPTLAACSKAAVQTDVVEIVLLFHQSSSLYIDGCLLKGCNQENRCLEVKRLQSRKPLSTGVKCFSEVWTSDFGCLLKGGKQK
jgi:hypothetical protein